MRDSVGMGLHLIPIVKALAPLLPAAADLVKRMRDKRDAAFAKGGAKPGSEAEWMELLEEQAQVIEQLTTQANNMASQLQEQEKINRRLKYRFRFAMALAIAALATGLLGVGIAFVAL